MLINAVKITGGIEPETYKSLLKYFDSVEKERISEKFNTGASARFLLSAILARVTACVYLGVRNKDISFLENSYGKPYLESFPAYGFNISHSGLWLVCGACDDIIGIDIEAVRGVDFKVAKRFFCEEEYNELMEKPEDERLNFFYDLWTLKESYIKSLGKGLSIPLNSFRINSDENGITLSGNEIEGVFAFKQYEVDIDYKLSVCVGKAIPDFPDTINIIEQNYLLEQFKIYAE